MKFIKVKTKLTKITSDFNGIDYEGLGLQRPDDEIETEENFIYINTEVLKRNLLLVMPDDDKCVLEFRDGTRIPIYISQEEFIKLITNMPKMSLWKYLKSLIS